MIQQVQSSVTEEAPFAEQESAFGVCESCEGCETPQKAKILQC